MLRDPSVGPGSGKIDDTPFSAVQPVHDTATEPSGSAGDARVDMDFLLAYQFAPITPSSSGEPTEVRKNVFTDDDHQDENEVVPSANFMTVWTLITTKRSLARAKRAQMPSLEGPGFVPTWAAAFHGNESLPNPPAGISYHKWADVLFGRLNCETCGAAFAVIDFTFAERRCYDCAEKALTTMDDFEACAPESIAWTLIKPCYLSVLFRSNFYHFTPDNEAFRIADITETMELVRQYERKIADSEEGAKEAYDAFKSSRLAMVQSAAEHKEVCDEWIKQISEDIDSDYQAAYDKSYNQITRYFIRDSYIRADVSQASFPTDATTIIKASRHRRWTKSRWNRIKPLLEPAVSQIREERVRAERLALIDAREKIVRDVFSKFKESTLPATWSYQPPAYTILGSEHFRGLINDPSDLPLTAEKCSEAAEHLPQLVEQWTREKMCQLASFLPSNASVDPPNLFDLDLATSVFHCLGSARSSIKAGRCLIGWDGAAPHLRCGALQNYWDRRLHFCQRGFDAAKALVELLELDPATTLARDVDFADHRFLCANCPSSESKWTKAMLWRDCVLHFIESEDDSHTVPRWALLSPVARDDVKRRGGADPYVYDSDWCCNHCPAHWETSVIGLVLFAIARNCNHEIGHPVEGLDFIYFVSTGRKMRQPVAFSEIAEYLCHECPSRKARRLYPLISLLRHLQDKHTIRAPVEGKNYKKVQLVLQSTLPPRS
ncbi:hypothetical protein BD779DRAFT_1671464 [Infundibulicybe gibba]|nr:hypothetical protein BD779DRAFT_1671464 [Infundibulicybe gibba]